VQQAISVKWSDNAKLWIIIRSTKKAHTRVQAFMPTFREIVAALDTLQAEREAAKAAPVVPPQPPAGRTGAGRREKAV
jgi:hypothetical protein